MKIAVAVATLAFAASVSAQAIGPVDPAKLPTGWCSMYTGTCEESTIITECGANSTYTAHCVSTFSTDKVCTSFTVSCVCTPQAGGDKKDVSAQALNETVTSMFSLRNEKGIQEQRMILSTCKKRRGTSQPNNLSFSSLTPYHLILQIAMPGMCDNLSFAKNTTSPGVISGDYLPNGKRPTSTANVTSPVTNPSKTASSGGAVTPTTTTTPGDGKSAASALQMALPTVALVAISMGLAMIPL